MKTEIEASELISHILEKNKKKHFKITYKRLREIGDLVEKENHTYRVVLNKSSLEKFHCQCIRYATFSEDKIEIREADNSFFKYFIEYYGKSEELKEIFKKVKL